MAGIIAPNIIDNGLVLYLDAANTKSYPTAGTVWTDLSKTNGSGSLVNGPTYNTANGGNIVFDGSNDSCTTTLIDNATYITYECVFKFNSVLGTQVVVGKFSGVGQDYWLGLFGGNMVFSTNGAILNSNRVASVGSIYVVTCVLSATSKNIYVNGIIANTASPASSSPNGSLVLANFGTYGGFPASVSMFNFKFYSRALTAAEVLQNYNATKGRYL